MARKNKFTYKSFIDDVGKELLKDERRVVRAAGGIMKRQITKTIKEKDIIDKGDLLKGVAIDAYQHTVLVGIAAPGFHALIVEYGTDERVGKDGHASGRMPAIPYMLPAFRIANPKMQRKMSEEW